MQRRLRTFVHHMVWHTYTSLAYSVGVDVKIVSQNLGHASTTVTLDKYTHLTEDKKREQGGDGLEGENLIRIVTIL